MKYKLCNTVGMIESKLPASIKGKLTIRIDIEGAASGTLQIGGHAYPVSKARATIEAVRLHAGEIPITYVDESGRGYILEPLHLSHNGTLDRGSSSPLFVNALCRYVSDTENKVAEIERRVCALEDAVYPDDNDIL